MNILYNIDLNTIQYFPDGYSIDGVLQPLGEVGEDIYHLEMVQTIKPTIEVTQYLTCNWEISGTSYIQVWTVHDRTNEEMVEFLTQLNNQAVESVKAELQQISLDDSYSNYVIELDNLPDAEAYELASQFPPWIPSGHLYATGNRFYYPPDGKLYKVISAGHTSQPDHLPDQAHSLYSPIPEPGTAPEWSTFASWQFAQMDIGTAVTDNNTIYYLTNPSQGHWQPSGAQGHLGWSITNPL